MTIEIRDPEIEAQLREQMERGCFSSAEEWVAHVLGVLNDDFTCTDEEKRELNAKIELGLRDLDEGRTISVEEFQRQFQARREAYRARRSE